MRINLLLRHSLCAPLLVQLLLCALPAAADTSVSHALRERVELHSDSPASAPQTQTARVTATINGHQAIEYLIDAKTGQSLELDVHSSNTRAGYRITAPAAPRALHRGHGQHSRFSVTLPRDGTYKVLIYLMRSAAQNGESAEFALDIRLSNPG
ncbi:hypothetical protein [Microbulbifer sp. YPW1]|uniref:hypothetical protein n=1 Tax=Microbulbifer sp. YPW1 TaxID=2745199 RepID=UPI00159A13F0|nr:hypothetical protein [Microbulbifer sp. YPW1]QKX18674.1 hypothetical protein HUW35_17800 [Microbulbifer sp. YPW1]